MLCVDLVRPRGPYSLELTAAGGTDATRRFRDGVLTATLRVGERLETAGASQRPDGAVVLRGESEGGLRRLRALLALDDDHTEFLRRFARDPLLGATTRRLAGLRVLRVPTVAQALLRALCGQLIESRRARAIEAAVVRAATPSHPGTGLHAAPSERCLALLSPADLAGSASTRAAAPRSSGSAAHSTSSACTACRPRSQPRASSASAVSARGRRASSASRGSAGPSTGSSVTSGS